MTDRSVILREMVCVALSGEEPRLAIRRPLFRIESRLMFRNYEGDWISVEPLSNEALSGLWEDVLSWCRTRAYYREKLAKQASVLR